MSPQTVRNPHGPRKQGVPANLIQRWQSSPRQVTRPQVRRPKTACERCRAAKVRCHGDGQHECNRCTSRGFSCRYVQPAPSPGPTATPSRSDSDRTTTPDEIGMNLDFSTKHRNELTVGDGIDSFQHLAETSVSWSDVGLPAEALEQQQYMDWNAVNPSATLELPSTIPTVPTPASEQRPSLSSLGLLPLITNATADDLVWQDQLASQSCQCRAGLAQLIPNARAALREQRLDGVFRVTSDVIRSCEAIVGCGVCTINCTELICIMAVFQEADACFDYVAKGNIDSVINVNMGSYDVGIGIGDRDAEHWRSKLVSQLVRRAHRLLDSISERGQEMLRALDPACRLGRVNIDYLEAVIRNSRTNLHLIMEGLEEVGTAE